MHTNNLRATLYLATRDLDAERCRLIEIDTGLGHRVGGAGPESCSGDYEYPAHGGLAIAWRSVPYRGGKAKPMGEVGMRMDKPDLTSADEAMEYAARLIEESSFSDFRGVASKRKRDREDAELRLQTAMAVRKNCAAHIRAFINRPDLEPKAILQRIAAGENATWLLADAWPLAWKGLCRIEAHVVCNSNSVPPETNFTISLTDKGREALE